MLLEMKKADIFHCQGQTNLCFSPDFQMFLEQLQSFQITFRCQIFDVMISKEPMVASMVRYDTPDRIYACTWNAHDS